MPVVPWRASDSIFFSLAYGWAKVDQSLTPAAQAQLSPAQDFSPAGQRR